MLKSKRSTRSEEEPISRTKSGQRSSLPAMGRRQKGVAGEGETPWSCRFDLLKKQNLTLDFTYNTYYWFVFF
jgi:hypothetical protein